MGGEYWSGGGRRIAVRRKEKIQHETKGSRDSAGPCWVCGCLEGCCRYSCTSQSPRRGCGGQSVYWGCSGCTLDLSPSVTEDQIPPRYLSSSLSHSLCSSLWGCLACPLHHCSWPSSPPEVSVCQSLFPPLLHHVVCQQLADAAWLSRGEGR